MVTEMQQKEHPWLIRYENADIVGGSDFLDRRISPEIGSIVCLSYRTTDTPSQEERNAVLVLRRAQPSGAFAFRGLLPQSSYEVYQGKIRILRGSGASGGGKFRIWYLANYPQLHYGPVVADGTENTLPLNTSPEAGLFNRSTPKIYNGALVYLYAGTGVGQRGRIVSVDSDYVATCESDEENGVEPFAADPPAVETDPNDTTRYSIQPPFPQQFYPLLVARAAAFGFTKKDMAPSAMAKVQARMPAWNSWLSAADLSSGIRIGRNFPGNLGLNQGGAGGFFSGMIG